MRAVQAHNRVFIFWDSEGVIIVMADSTDLSSTNSATNLSPNSATSQDSFLKGQVRIKQFLDGYRVGTDTVLLAASINPPFYVKSRAPGVATMLDMGAGVGGVSLALMHRLKQDSAPPPHITAIEKERASFALLGENIEANGMGRDIRPVHGDIMALPADFRDAFDYVFANPPFHSAHSSTHQGRGGGGDAVPLSSRRSLALYGDGAGLRDWVRVALWAVKPKGRISMIIRADRADEVISALHAAGAGGLSLHPIFSYIDRPAIRVLISARRAIDSPMLISSGLVLYEGSGVLTSRACSVMKGGALLFHSSVRQK